MNRRLAALLVLLPALALADEGMWTFDAFPADEVARSYGFRPPPAWLDAARLASVRLSDGCSGSLVSPDGLLMTNHHCALECVEELSTAEVDYVRDGFWAVTSVEERRCPALEVDQLLEITDVTARVLAATAGKEGAAFSAALQAEKAAVEQACQTAPELRCTVVTLYHGGAHSLYRYRRYRDVRLVFAPEDAIADFGGDPDNFEFPRYDLDVAFLRVYEGGRPASTPDHLRWSRAGARAGELTFVAGAPGRTSRLLTVAQLEHERQFELPDALQRLAEQRGLLSGFQLLGSEERRRVTSILLELENGVKARRGMLEALRDPAFFALKVGEEQALRAALGKDPERAARYLSAFDAIARAQARYEQLRKPYTWLEAEPGRRRTAGELFFIARTLLRGAEERSKPAASRLYDFQDAALPRLSATLLSDAPIYPELEALRLAFWLGKVREHLGADHPAVRHLLGRSSPEEVAVRAVEGTRLADVAVRRALWEGGAGGVAASDDPMLALARLADADARAVRKAVEDEVEAVDQRSQSTLAAARFALHGRSIYPDATGTPRLSYGAVQGWTEGGREVAPFTTFGGAFERNTGREPFALPPRWLAARGRLDPSTPFNFTTSNDVVGGNSGSPVFNRELEVVGLVFDGNLPSLGGDYGFDPAVNRTVAVHSEALLEALCKVYGATRLVAELSPRGGGAGPLPCGSRPATGD